MYQLDPPITSPALDWVPPPTQDTLLCDDGIPMETYRHKLQMDLLVEPLNTWLVLGQNRGFVGGNMFVYFSPAQVRNQDYRGPDVFAVMDVAIGERKSWVVWEEGKAPDIVIELLSTSTAAQDKTEKKLIYQNQLRVPEYVWYDPFNPTDFVGFALHQGAYQPIPLDNQGRLISQRLGLVLVRWQGYFREVETTWLRWATLEGTLLPTDQENRIQEQQRADQEQQRAEQAQQRTEQAQQQAEQAQQQAEQERQRADQEQQRADQEQQRAEQAQQRADALAAKLRALGVDPDAS